MASGGQTPRDKMAMSRPNPPQVSLANRLCLHTSMRSPRPALVSSRVPRFPYRGGTKTPVKYLDIFWRSSGMSTSSWRFGDPAQWRWGSLAVQTWRCSENVGFAPFSSRFAGLARHNAINNHASQLITQAACKLKLMRLSSATSTSGDLVQKVKPTAQTP
jgi:hypothetical protein